MDKRGFLKIMEAVIAIILVFSVVLYILPKAEKVTFKIPPDLELIAGTILDDAQNDEEFRKCILKNKGEDNYPNCVRTEVERGIGTGTLWQHAENDRRGYGKGWRPLSFSAAPHADISFFPD